MTNPKAGHTSATGYGANSQGLRDGDGLTSLVLPIFTRGCMATVSSD